MLFKLEELRHAVRSSSPLAQVYILGKKDLRTREAWGMSGGVRPKRELQVEHPYASIIGKQRNDIKEIYPR